MRRGRVPTAAAGVPRGSGSLTQKGEAAMIDRESPNDNPKNWTVKYVRAHWSECLLLLRELNLRAVKCIEARRCWTAGESLDLLLDGFDLLLKSRRSDKIRSCIANCSFAAAELCTLVDPAAFESDMRNQGFRPDLQGERMAGYLRDVGMKGFENARSYAGSGELRDRAALMARALREGIPAERIRREYAPDFPEDIQERLLKLDDDFFVPEIMRCAPERCAVLDKKRLIFRQELVESASKEVPAGFGPVEVSEEEQERLPAEVPARLPAEAPARLPAEAPERTSAEAAISPYKANVVADSYFDGNTLQLIGYRIAAFLLCLITLGLAFPWVACMLKSWEVKHTVICGRRLKFDGRGSQLFGNWLLWSLLTFITFGIYSLWLGVNMKKWMVKHTFYADGQGFAQSYFSGGVGGSLGIHILAFLLTFFTLGIGTAWAVTMVQRWETGHTHVGGDTLEFNGTGLQLLGKSLLMGLLTIITFGIYTLFIPVSYMKWLIKHTVVKGRSVERGEQTAPAAPDSGGRSPRAPIAAVAAVVLVLAVVLCVRAGMVSARPSAFAVPAISLPNISGLAKSIPGIGGSIGAVRAGFASDPQREKPPAAPELLLTDQELLALAEERVNSGVELWIANAGFLETDDSDLILQEDEMGYSSTFSRVIGYDTVAEAEEAAMELWYGTYSRRMSLSAADSSMDMLRFQLTERDGKLYRRWDGGVGDGGYYTVVDYMVSRTDDEAVFQARLVMDDEDDGLPFRFSLVREDGTWKYLGDQE